MTVEELSSELDNHLTHHWGKTPIGDRVLWSREAIYIIGISRTKLGDLEYEFFSEPHDLTDGVYYSSSDLDHILWAIDSEGLPLRGEQNAV